MADSTNTQKEPLTINGYTALRRDRWSVRDLRGVHVRMPWRGRMLLGEVVDQYYQYFDPSGWFFKVRHFCGDPWPVDPVCSAVEVLLRRTGDEVED
jgi:hypothetical protein